MAIPNDDFRQPLAAATYTVAVFTIIGPGLTLAWLARRIGIDGTEEPTESAVSVPDNRWH